MVSDNIVLWSIALFLEWFFLARKGGDNEGDSTSGKENLGWFFILLTSAIGIAVVGDGEDAMSFLVGGVVMVISIIKLIRNFMED